MYYPILLDIKDRRVLVIGGGRVAERKVRTFLECGAHVRLIAPAATEYIAELAGRAAIEYEAREYRAGDVADVALVVAAVDDEDVSSAIAEECRAAGVFVNVVDKPAHCDFIVPAVVRRGELTLAVSTGGASPAMAKQLRKRLEAEFGEEYGRVLEAARRIRQRCLDGIEDAAKRKAALEQLADELFLELARELDVDALEEEMATRIGLVCK